MTFRSCDIIQCGKVRVIALSPRGLDQVVPPGPDPVATLAGARVSCGTTRQGCLPGRQPGLLGGGRRRRHAHDLAGEFCPPGARPRRQEAQPAPARTAMSDSRRSAVGGRADRTLHRTRVHPPIGPGHKNEKCIRPGWFSMMKVWCWKIPVSRNLHSEFP
jgi:hypothetical protein